MANIVSNPSSPQSITGESLTLDATAPLIVDTLTVDTSLNAQSINNVLYVGPGAQYSTLEAALSALPSTGGTVIVAPGHTEIIPTALLGGVNPFQAFTTGSNGEVICGQGVVITTNVQIVVPDGWKLRGMNGQGGLGASIVADSNFPVSTPIVQLGYSTNSNNTRLEDIFINASDISGSIGVQTHGLQELCGMLRVTIANAVNQGLYIDPSCQDSDYDCLYIGMSGSSGNTSVGINVDVSGPMGRGIRNSTIFTNSSTPLASGIALASAQAIAIENIHFEHCTDGITVNSGGSLTCANVLISNISGHSSVTNLVHIPYVSGTRSIEVFNLYANGASTPLVQNFASSTFTCANSDVAAYIVGVDGTVYTTDTGYPQAITGGGLVATTTDGTYSPTATNLSHTGGAPTITGHWSRVGNLVYFQIMITPSAGNTTSSTAPVTYISLPSSPGREGICIAVQEGASPLNTGIIDTSGNVYPPTWTNSSVYVLISGIYEVN